MKYFYFLVEEESMVPVINKVALEIFQKEEAGFQILPHQGKQDLRKALQKTVPTLSQNPPGSRIIVLHDQDNADCKALKEALLDDLKNCHCPYKVRIVCTELESWFLGDLEAIAKAYKKFKPAQHRTKKPFRNVDTIKKPWQTLLKIVPEFQRHQFLPKVTFAQEVAEHLSLEQNTSASFHQFIKGIQSLI